MPSTQPTVAPPPRQYTDQTGTLPTNPPQTVVIGNDGFICKINDGQHQSGSEVSRFLPRSSFAKSLT